MTSSAVSSTHFGVTRLTIDVGSPAPDFRSRYEEAVPPMPSDRVNELVTQQSPWHEMRELIDSVAPFGFVI
jgi:hypothetical protein